MAEDSEELDLYDVVEATFNPDRTDDLRPELVKYIGYRGLFEVTGHVDETVRSDGAYAGQLMMTPFRHDEWFYWVPSGDLEIHRTLSFEESRQEHKAYMTRHRAVADKAQSLVINHGKITIGDRDAGPVMILPIAPEKTDHLVAVIYENGMYRSYTVDDGVWTQRQAVDCKPGDQFRIHLGKEGWLVIVKEELDDPLS